MSLDGGRARSYVLIVVEKSLRAPTMNTKQVIDALSALAHETRLAVFRMLVQKGPEGIPAGTIAESLGIPPSSLTFHLQQLLHAGLVTQRRLSRQLIYAADFAAMNGVLGFLTENCCGGNAAACATPACDPAAAFKKGESDEKAARPRQRR
jgi:ArsR family transcriptional regulator